MFASILGVLTGLGGPIINLGAQIVDLQKQKADGKTQVAKAEIDAKVEELHDKRAVYIAEAGSRLASALNAVMRFIYALPGAFVIWKLAFDRVVGSLVGCAGPQAKELLHCSIYRTDPLSDNEWKVIFAAIGFYFVTTIVDKIKR